MEAQLGPHTLPPTQPYIGCGQNMATVAVSYLHVGHSWAPGSQLLAVVTSQLGTGRDNKNLYCCHMFSGQKVEAVMSTI